MSDAPERPTHFERAALLAAVAIAGLAGLRTMVQLVPITWFDMDPALAPSDAGWGPAHTLLLDALVLVLSGFVLAVSAPRARRGDVLVALAALVPAVPLALHAMDGPYAADDLWRGAGWLSAMVGAAALWIAVRTLPRGEALRAALLAVLLAVAGPLVVRSATQLVVEHAAMVEDYEKNPAAQAAARGMSPDSPQILVFERRLRQLEATGWIGLSNVHSSLLGAMGLALMGLAVAGWRSLERGSTLLLAAGGAGCLAVVGINGSRGAIGAVALGFAAAVVLAAMGAGALRRNALSRTSATPGGATAARTGAARSLAWMGPTLVVLAVMAIVVRGQIGEPWGERSLLFRWHYTLGAWAVWLQHPWLGAGPAGFAEAYLTARPDRAPEEVLSAHSMWLDWLAALGVTALTWSALALAWVWQGCRRAEQVSASAEPASLGRRFVVVALGTVLAMTLAAMLAELHRLDAVGLVARPVGLALGLALAVAAVQALESASRLASLGLAAAVVALAVHAQIEMTLFFPGSAAWVAAFLAAVASTPVGGSRVARPKFAASARMLAVGALASVVLGCAVFGMGAVPAAIEVRQLESAAEPIVKAAQRTSASQAAAPVPAAVRIEAARMLAEPNAWSDAFGDRPVRLAASLEQWSVALAGVPVTDPSFASLATQALGAAEAAVRRSPTDTVRAAAQSTALEASRTSDDALRRAALESVARWAADQLATSPRSVGAWLRLAHAQEALGRRDEARQSYHGALKADATYELDPLRRLSEADRAAIEARARGGA